MIEKFECIFIIKYWICFRKKAQMPFGFAILTESPTSSMLETLETGGKWTQSVYRVTTCRVRTLTLLTGHPGRGFYRRIVNTFWKSFIFHDYMKSDTSFPIVIYFDSVPAPASAVCPLSVLAAEEEI